MKSFRKLRKLKDFHKLYYPPIEHTYSSNYRRLALVILIAVAFVALEVVAGIIANSISIISDAFHLICDVTGYASSFLFMYLSRKPSTFKMTFGYHRM
jgi:Co/Zn/Cd efflux system component